MRSMANTSISFGLVNVPVKVYKATEDHSVGFHQYHGGGCNGAVGQQRLCKTCGEVVEYGDIIKGIECDGELVIVTPEELAAVERETSPGIEILEIVHAEQIDPIILESPYFLAPDAKSLQGYVLLREVLRESERVGIARYVIRGAAHLAVLQVRRKVLILQNITWADEIRDPREFAILDKPVEITPKMLKAAQQLVESMMVEQFNHAQHTDGYAERVRALVDAKAAGAVPMPASAEDEGSEDVSDLLVALERKVFSAIRQERNVRARRPEPTDPTPNSALRRGTLTTARSDNHDEHNHELA
jgi:DNA end-binding protein Ku